MRLAILFAFALPLAAQERLPTPFEEHKVIVLLQGDGGRTAPSLTTVAKRRNAGYIRAMIEDPQRIVPGSGMPRTSMPAATRELLIRYIARGAAPGAVPGAVPAQSPLVRANAASGPSRYQRWCASCHGVDGNGDGPDTKFLPVPPAMHTSAAKMSARSDDALYDVIAGGGAVMGKSVRMPAFGATLSPDEIRALVAYIRTKCSCVGPAWSRDGSGR
jgi:mono/diheme cytochrome c family protein